MIIILLISLLTTFEPPQDCPTITASAVVKDATDGQADGEITIEAKGGKGKLRYFLFRDGKPVNSNTELEKTIKNLKAGRYICSIVDESGCIKKLEIELK
ncbi:MAG: hypothetical protein ACOYXA_09755 [Bacteroidota bacterium]